MSTEWGAPLLFVDTETTGLVPGRHVVWEIAWVMATVEDNKLVCHNDYTFHGQIRLSHRQAMEADTQALDIGKFNERYDPDFALSPVGVSQILVRHCAAWKEKLALPWLVANNPTFDHNMIVTSLFGGFPDFGESWWHHQMINIVDQGAMKLGWKPPYRSWDVGAALGQPIDQETAHSAWVDTEWNIRVFAATHDLTIAHAPTADQIRRRYPQPGETWTCMYQGKLQRREILEATPGRVRARIFDITHGKGYGKGRRDGQPWEQWFELRYVLDHWTPPEGVNRFTSASNPDDVVTAPRKEMWRQM